MNETTLQAWQKAIANFNNDFEPKMNETTILRTQDDAINAVRNQFYIIGSVANNGDLSFSASPTIHRTPQDARQECKRLASQNHGRVFVFVRLQGAELVLVPIASTISI